MNKENLLEIMTIKNVMLDMGVSERTAKKYLHDIKVEFKLVKPVKPVTRIHFLKYLNLL